MKNIKKKLYLTKKKIEEFSISNYYSYIKDDSLLLKYWDFENNWGDKVNPYLVEKLIGTKVISSNSIYNFLAKPEILGIGSIIVGDLSNYVIWGSGIISEKTDMQRIFITCFKIRNYELFRIRYRTVFTNNT